MHGSRGVCGGGGGGGQGEYPLRSWTPLTNLSGSGHGPNIRPIALLDRSVLGCLKEALCICDKYQNIMNWLIFRIPPSNKLLDLFILA